MALLLENKVLVHERRTADQFTQKGFGEREDRDLVLDLWEAAYLCDKEKLEVVDEHRKPVARDQLLAHAGKKDKRFYSKYLVYADLRTRGYIVKTGFKFGADFRVYPRGKKPGEAHTEWVVHVFTQDDKFTFTEFSRMVLLAGNLKTKMLAAVVDAENAVNYYAVDRVTP